MTTIVLLIVIAVLLVIFALIIGLYCGYQYYKSEAQKGLPEGLQGVIKGPVGATGPPGPEGPPGPPGAGLNAETMKRIDILWTERSAHTNEESGLTARMSAIEDRMKRVERKSGMSV